MDRVDHDDRIVDEPPDREQQADQGRAVDREVHRPEEQDGKAQARRNRRHDDQRRADVFQEDQQDEPGQDHAGDQFLEHVLRERVDEACVVVGDRELQARMLSFEPRDPFGDHGQDAR